LFVDPSDCIFSTWWNIPAYFETTSQGEFVSCPDEETCKERAKEKVGRELGGKYHEQNPTDYFGLAFRFLFPINHLSNGERGIELFRKGKFDMVLTDLGMPEMSGWEVCRAIKKINPHLPVGMITGWGAGIDQPQMEENRLDFVISKPFDSEEVLNQIAEKVSSK
jgi:CheY-like chemotaxis protein